MATRRGEGQRLVAPADPGQGEQHGGPVASRLRRDRLRPDGRPPIAEPAPAAVERPHRRRPPLRRPRSRRPPSVPGAAASARRSRCGDRGGTPAGISTAAGPRTGRTILLHRLARARRHPRPASGSSRCCATTACADKEAHPTMRATRPRVVGRPPETPARGCDTIRARRRASEQRRPSSSVAAASPAASIQEGSVREIDCASRRRPRRGEPRA